MSLNWTQFEGKYAGGWRLDSFLGERDEKAFFTGRKEGQAKAALIELMEGTPEADAVLASWSLARRFAHEHLLAVYSAGVAEVDPGVSVAYAVLEMPEDDLSEIVPRRTLEESEVMAMLLGPAHALEYLHNHGVTHGAVLPPNLFVVGGGYKLSVDNLSAAGHERKAGDIRQLGATLVWALSGGSEPPNQRPSAESIARLELPFREYAIGCLNSGWTATQLVAALEGRYVPPADELPAVTEPLPAAPADFAPVHKKTARLSERWVLAAIIVAALLLVMVYLLSARGGRNANASSSVTPVPAAEPPATAPQPAPPATAPTRDHGSADREMSAPVAAGGWAVVAAAYDTRDGAQKRADHIHARWERLQAYVFPTSGDADRYLVVIGSGLSKDSAEALKGRALSAGVAKDSYVTKLSSR
jgi:cell division septation protein DedD